MAKVSDRTCAKIEELEEGSQHVGRGHKQTGRRRQRVDRRAALSRTADSRTASTNNDPAFTATNSAVSGSSTRSGSTRSQRATTAAANGARRVVHHLEQVRLERGSVDEMMRPLDDVNELQVMDDVRADR